MTSPNARCDWANCKGDMLKRVDGYNFCGRHLRSHYTQFPKRPRPLDQIQPCGTNAAYSRHIRNDELPCQACLDAHRLYNRQRKDKRIVDRKKNGYTGGDAARLAGITYRQLDFWFRAGILGPDIHSPGSGHDRQISDELLGHIQRIAILVKLGFAASRAAELVRFATVTEDGGLIVDRGDVVITVRGAA